LDCHSLLLEHTGLGNVNAWPTRVGSGGPASPRTLDSSLTVAAHDVNDPRQHWRVEEP